MDLDNVIEELGQIDGVEACILYRIDSTPIRSYILGFQEFMLDILNWLERQVNFVFRQMEMEEVETATFIYKGYTVILKVSSRSTVLAVVMNPEANHLLVSVEVTRASEKIKDMVS
jgi:predicted regulator of Ras-like GTPase activity (Roadblock/LC7/MglB family)